MHEVSGAYLFRLRTGARVQPFFGAGGGIIAVQSQEEREFKSCSAASEQAGLALFRWN
jgi:hypothetical protein